MTKLCYRPDSTIIDRMGGEAGLEAVRARVTPLELPRCPFCGGEAEVALLSFGMDLLVRVRCRDCRCAAVDVTVSYDPIGKRPVGFHAALKRAVELWSRREGARA